jgi:hypothetical protein
MAPTSDDDKLDEKAEEPFESQDLVDRLSLEDHLPAEISYPGVPPKHKIIRNFPLEVAQHILTTTMKVTKQVYNLHQFPFHKRELLENMLGYAESHPQVMESIRNDLKKKLPSKSKDSNEFTALKGGTAFLYATLAFKPDQKDLTALLRGRTSIFGVETTSLSQYQHLMYIYTATGGELGQAGKIAALLRKGNPISNFNAIHSLWNARIYGSEGYSSFSYLLNQLLELTHFKNLEIQAFCKTVGEVHGYALDCGNMLAPSEMLEEIIKISQEAFDSDNEILPKIASHFNQNFSRLVKEISKESRGNLRFKKEYPLRKTVSDKIIKEITDAFTSVPPSLKRRVLEIVSRSWHGTEGLASNQLLYNLIPKKVARDPSALPHLEQILSLVSRANSFITNSQDRLSYGIAFENTVRELELSPPDREQKNRLRELMIGKFSWNGKELSELWKKYHNGKYAEVSDDHLIELINEVTLDYLGKKRSHSFSALEMRINCCKVLGEDAFKSFSKKVKSIYLQTLPVYREDIERKELQRANYDDFFQAILPELNEVSPKMIDLIVRKENRLVEFLDFMQDKMNLKHTEKKEIFLAYLKKSQGILSSLGEEEREEKYSHWFSALLKLPTLAHLSQELSPGARLGAELLSEEDSLYELGTEREVWRRLASLYAHRNLSLEELPGIHPNNFSFPLPTIGRIALPQFVNLFSSEEENRELCSNLASLQAVFFRYGYFEEKKEGELNVFFDQFANPQYAYRIWIQLNYARAKAVIANEWPSLSQRVEESFGAAGKKISSALETAPTAATALQTLERNILLGVDFSAISGYNKLLEELVSSLPQDWEAVENQSLRVQQEVKRIYENLEKRFMIPPTRKEAVNGKDNTTLHLVNRTGASYVGQPIFYYDEEGGGKARLVMGEASGFPNQQLERSRQASKNELVQLCSLLEQIKPQRVTIKRRMYDGEVDEQAYTDYLLEREAGQNSEPNVFVQRRITEREIAVLLSINQNRNLGQWLGEKRMISYALTTTVYFMEALKILEDSFAIVGYTSRGPNEVFVNNFKSFSEKVTSEIEHKIGLLAPLNQSRTGTFYKHVPTLFENVLSRRKIHFDIVTELANDEGYTGITGIQDTYVGACRERAAGIELFAFCLDQKASKEVLDQIYGPGRYLIITNPEHLPRVAIETYRKLTL